MFYSKLKKTFEPLEIDYTNPCTVDIGDDTVPQQICQVNKDGPDPGKIVECGAAHATACVDNGIPWDPTGGDPVCGSKWKGDESSGDIEPCLCYRQWLPPTWQCGDGGWSVHCPGSQTDADVGCNNIGSCNKKIFAGAWDPKTGNLYCPTLDKLTYAGCTGGADSTKPVVCGNEGALTASATNTRGVTGANVTYTPVNQGVLRSAITDTKSWIHGSTGSWGNCTQEDLKKACTTSNDAGKDLCLRSCYNAPHVNTEFLQDCYEHCLTCVKFECTGCTRCSCSDTGVDHQMCEIPDQLRIGKKAYVMNCYQPKFCGGNVVVNPHITEPCKCSLRLDPITEPGWQSCRNAPC